MTHFTSPPFSMSPSFYAVSMQELLEKEDDGTGNEPKAVGSQKCEHLHFGFAINA